MRTGSIVVSCCAVRLPPFVYDSKADEVHIKGYVRGIVQTDMKKKQVAGYVDSAQQGRHAELTAADMFHIAAVALVYCTHELMHQRRVLCPQFRPPARRHPPERDSLRSSIGPC